MRIEGSIQHAERGEQCEYCVVVSITNEQGEKIARHVVGVGRFAARRAAQYSFSVELMPVRAVPAQGDRPQLISAASCLRCR